MGDIVLQAHAKLNLTLKILGRRPDGYHNIESVVQSVGLYDRISLKSGPPVPVKNCGESHRMNIKATCNDPTIPAGSGNLAVDAAFALARFAGLTASVEIHIDKSIPVAAGLGGGSADAAAVLIGLNHLWKLGLSPDELVAVGEKLGADIPFCVTGGTGIIRGKGERVESLPTPDNLWFVIVTLPDRISAAQAYAGFDRLTGTGGAYDAGGSYADNGDACGTCHAYGRNSDTYDTCDACGRTADACSACDAGERKAGVYDTCDACGRTADAYSTCDAGERSADAYRACDACDHTTYAYDDSVNATDVTSKMVRAVKAGRVQDIADGLTNDLERSVVPIVPSITWVKQSLIAEGALGAGMSGSGPTVFGIADSRAKAEAIHSALRRASFSGEPKQALSSGELKQALLGCEREQALSSCEPKQVLSRCGREQATSCGRMEQRSCGSRMEQALPGGTTGRRAFKGIFVCQAVPRGVTKLIT